MKMEALKKANALVAQVEDLVHHKKEVLLRLNDTAENKSRLRLYLNPENWGTFPLRNEFTPLAPHVFGRAYIAAIDAKIQELEAEFVALKSE